MFKAKHKYKSYVLSIIALLLNILMKFYKILKSAKESTN